MKINLFIFSVLIVLGCKNKPEPKENVSQLHITNTSLVILGTVQDAGSPQIACNKKCCATLFENPDHNRLVVSLGLVDTENHKTYMFEATPDIGKQMKMITQFDPKMNREFTDGIFITHAHIGHYTGLMYLGMEGMDAKSLPVYVMPQMKKFLTKNGPWNQLILRKNILLNQMENEQEIKLSKTVAVTPVLVPHRDEFSETVGYIIQGPKKRALFIPDIDKWEKWGKSIVEEIQKVDYAFLDATFYSAEEINHRDMSEIPHPFVMESFEVFKNLSAEEKNKIIFIHFNHTNPLLNVGSEESQTVLDKGYKIGRINDVFEL